MKSLWKYMTIAPIFIQLAMFFLFFSLSELNFYQYIQHIVLISAFSLMTVVICAIQFNSYSYNLAVIATACHGGGAVILWILGFFLSLMLEISKDGDKLFTSLLAWTSVFSAVQFFNSGIFLMTTIGYRNKHL